MREDLTIPEIPIPGELSQRVEKAMTQVRAIHRKRVLGRCSAVMACFVAVAAGLLTLSCANPALASQIPLVGKWLGSLFYETNYESKTGTNGAYFETYDVLEDVNAAAVTESEDWEITFQQGYTDGNTVQLSLSLAGPQEDLDGYTGIDVGSYGSGSTAIINGEEAAVEGVNPFYERSGQWTTTMTIAVPESQLEADLLEISVTLRDLTGRVKNSGGPDPAQDQAIPGEFEAQFTLTVDRDHQFSFTSDAQSNGAKVLAVSGTPTQTVITVEKPFWGLGDSIVESQTPAQGEPYLVLSDGTQLRYDFTRSQELGGYDYQAQETQTADLYFDGLPAGADQAVLRFYGGYNQETVLAEFTIHVESQTVTPSATYEEGGLLDLSSPYRYEILQSNAYDLEGNGFAVASVVFRNYETYTSSVFFCVPQEWAEARLKVEVYDAQDTLLWESSAYNSDGGWNEGWQSTSPEDSQLGKLEQEAGESGETRWEFSVSQELTGRMAAIGEQVTVKILDEDTGDILFTDTQTLDQVQR